MSFETEKTIWDNYYSQALAGIGQEQETETSLWWNMSDQDAVKLITSLFPRGGPISVLEAGCGSGITSFDLSHSVPLRKLCLLDGSPQALKYAKTLEHRASVPEIEYIEGNVFNLSPLQKTFDLVWNIGLIEHYQRDEISRIVKEMFNTTAPKGWIIIGIPNRDSLAVKKAALLGSPFGQKYLSWAKGYRNTTEILYGNAEIKTLIEDTVGEKVQVHYAGSPLWASASNLLVRWCDRITSLKKHAFLTLFAVRKRS